MQSKGSMKFHAIWKFLGPGDIQISIVVLFAIVSKALRLFKV